MSTNPPNPSQQEEREALRAGLRIVFFPSPVPIESEGDVKVVLDKAMALVDQYSAQREKRLVVEAEAKASIARLMNLKAVRAKARLAVYHEVEDNWDKPGFKKYILTLHDNDLKMLEDAQVKRQLPSDPKGKGGEG